MFKHILVPTDGSKLSDKALGTAIKLAKLAGARITVLHIAERFDPMLYAEGYVVDPDLGKNYEKAAREKGREYLRRAEEMAKKAGVRAAAKLAMSNQPHKEIISAARSGDCDVIVMASHGRRGLSALILGSETTKVLTHCKRPVLVVR